MGRAFGGSGKVRRLGFSQETTQQRLVNRRTSTHIRIKEYEERIDEGEEQVRDALVRHSDLIVDTDALRLPGIDPAWSGPEGLRLRPDYWPELGGMDGFYVAVLRRPD